MLNVYIVKRPFKSGGEYYPAGTVLTETAGIRLFKLKVSDGKVVQVTEQNLDYICGYFDQRMGLDVREDLIKGLQGAPAEPTEEELKAQEYLEKVKDFASKYDVDMEGRTLEEVVAEIKQKQAAEKAAATGK